MLATTYQKLHFILYALFMLEHRKSNAQLQPFFYLIVPDIQQTNFVLTPNENQYHLRLVLPNGSEREEFVELKNPKTSEEEFTIMGTIKIYYPELDYTSITSYTSNKNGYITKYKLQKGNLLDYTEITETTTTGPATTTNNNETPLEPANRGAFQYVKRKPKPPRNPNAIPYSPDTLKLTTRLGRPQTPKNITTNS